MLIGDRVVIRYRLEPGAPADWRNADGATLSDVTGYLCEDGDPLVVRRGAPNSDDVVAVPAHLVESVRVLSYTTVRNSQIRAVETEHAHAHPGTEQAVLDGWLVRAGNREPMDNAAVPVDLSAHPAGLTAVRDWFREHDTKPWAAIPPRLMTMPTPDTVIEVLTDGDSWLRLPRSTRDARIAARRNGFRLHHDVGYHRL